ncbi:hypothetical protein N9992_00215 [bacterium]|nr:hypothetical protein [bacterium]
MAEWKKVIVSGSAAELGSLTLTTGLANTELANDGITIAGVDTSLGGTITAATIGDAIGAFSSSAQVTGVTNAQLQNDGITIGDQDTSLGGSVLNDLTHSATGSFTGSFTGDGSNLTGVSATSFDFDGLPTITSLNGGDFFAASQGGTESKIIFANISSSIYGGVSGDATIAADGTLTIAADSVALGTDTTGNYVATVANVTNGGITVNNSGAETAGVTLGLDLDNLAAADIDVANDEIAFGDGGAGAKKESIADLATAMAGTGITATNGVFTTNDSEIDHDSLNNFSADEHFTQANITTVGTVTTGDVSAILPAGTVSASVLSSATQGTAVLTTNGVAGSTIDLGLETGDSPTFANLTITNDLTVQGSTTSLETTNLTIEDQFITIASGSQAATDGGFIVSKQADGAGFAFGYDTTTTRWVLDADLAVNATDIVADAYLSTIEVSAAVPSAAPTYGGASNGYGNMHVKTDTGDIYIYA